MKPKINATGIIINILFFISCAQQAGYSDLKGPYLGQKPPGLTPEIFAPGIISKTGNHLHSCVSFSPDGKEVYFTYMVFDSVRQGTIYFLKRVGNRWTERQVAPFSGVYSDDSPVFSPDGSKLYFTSNRPIDKTDITDDLNFWYVSRTGSGWSEPVYLDNVLNTDSCDFRLSIARNGTVYLSSDRTYSGRRSFDIFVSKLINGSYSTPVKIEDAITTPVTEQIGFVAPDESYLVFYRYPPNNRPEVGLYISFNKEDGSWTRAKNMGDIFNAPQDSCTQAASLSPDGKYLFFLRRYKEAIYWVDANIIDNLKPEK